MIKFLITFMILNCFESCSFVSPYKNSSSKTSKSKFLFVVDSSKDALPLVSEIQDKNDDEENDKENNKVKKDTDANTQTEIAANPSVLNERKIQHYQMQQEDTLMLVAFKIYGDYRKWKDLLLLNKDKELGKGVIIDYIIPDQSFEWNPKGVPYLVKKGDTLKTISQKKYGTVKRWKSILENNRPLIHTPELIFAGFTLYIEK